VPAPCPQTSIHRCTKTRSMARPESIRSARGAAQLRVARVGRSAVDFANVDADGDCDSKPSAARRTAGCGAHGCRWERHCA
jgi:hypothetical protein